MQQLLRNVAVLLLMHCCLCCLLASLVKADRAHRETLRDVEAYAEQLAQQRLFSGMLLVNQGGSSVLERGFGLSSYELEAPMRHNHRYPIGSNTKLFTAVAVWQLHRAGKLSVYDAASKYINSTELGLHGPWCPREYNASITGPCQQPQIQHLLRMSGGVLGFDDCAYPAGAWQQQYCLGDGGRGKALDNISFTDYQTLQLGAASITDYLRLTGVLKMPLEFQPGSHYHYSNPGYSLTGYIVEKVSGMSIADYFQTHIFDKYGLSSTLYDPTNGVIGIHKSELPFPAYIAYLQPGQKDAVADTSGASIDQLTASTGSSQYWGGDYRTLSSGSNSTATVSGRMGTASRSAGGFSSNPEVVSVGMTTKYPGPSGLDWSLANAAGAIVSTPQDMAKWFRALLVDSEHLGLGKELLRELLTLSTDIPGMPMFNVSSDGRDGTSKTQNGTLAFAQGLLVMKDAQHPRGLGVSSVYYLGSLGGFQASVYMWLHPTDPSSDVFINSVAATVLPAQQDWPAGAHSLLCRAGTQQAGTEADNRKSTTRRGSAAAASAVTGVRHRRLLSSNAPAAAGSGSATQVNVHVVEGLLCDLNNMVPSVIKTVPDLLARRAFGGLTGREWFGIQ